MPASAAGAAAARAGEPLIQAYKGMAESVRRMAEAAVTNADNYEVVDEAFKAQLAGVGKALP